MTAHNDINIFILEQIRHRIITFEIANIIIVKIYME